MCNERLQTISYLIPDENIRNIIFNFDNKNDDFMTDDGMCISYFSNLMTFTATIVLNAFLEWKRNYNMSLNGSELSNSMMRIYNMLDRAYDPNKFNCNFVNDLIFNLEMDQLMDTNNEKCFSEVIGIKKLFKFDKDNQLSHYIYQLKQKRISSKFKPDFGFKQLCDCFKMFIFLENIKADYYDKNIIFNGAKTDLRGVSIDLSNCSECKFSKLDLMYSLCIDDGLGVYYMEDFAFDDAKTFEASKSKNQQLSLNYVMFDGRGTFSVAIVDGSGEKPSSSGYEIQTPTAIERFFIDYDVINMTYKNANIGFFRDYMMLNNKYLKELSRTIADTLSGDVKSKIKSHYSRYRSVFDKMYITSLYNKADLIGYRWDEIVLFLMLEEGVYDFLKFLLCSGLSYSMFINMFKRRFDSKKVQEIIDSNPFIKNPDIKLQDTFSKSNNRIECCARALMLLASKLLKTNDWNVEESIYPTTIDDILAEVDYIYKSKKYDERSTTLYLINIVIRTALFINDFYRAVFEFARMRKNKFIELEMKGITDYNSYRIANDECVSKLRENYAKYSSTASSEFEWRGEQTSNMCSRAINKVNQVFELLEITNRRCVNHKDWLSEIVFDTLGRRRLFDSKIMESLRYNLVEALNSAPILNDKLFIAVLAFLTYLKKGEPSNNGDSVLENAIYPIIGQYYSGVISRDGYKYSYFKMNVDKDLDLEEQAIKVKVITDDEFDFGYSYYCIPNVHRIANMDDLNSENRIWVDPIILPCSIFLPSTVMYIEKLTDVSDYQKAAELIYMSDQNLYAGFFGSLENAKKVLPFMFDNRNSKFCKKYYSLLKQEGKIVAIAALFNSNDFKLDVDIEYKAFRDSGVQPPDTFDSAISSLAQVFNDFIGTSYCLIDDVCVANEYRRKGNGKSLILYLAKKAATEGKQVMLSVDCENVAAYNLYSSLGFIEYSSEKSMDKIGKEYAKMIKI